MAFVLESSEFREFLKERLDELIRDEDVRKILRRELWGKKKTMKHILSLPERVAEELLEPPREPWEELRRAAIMGKFGQHQKILEIRETRLRKRKPPAELEKIVKGVLEDTRVDDEELKDMVTYLILKKVFVPWASEQVRLKSRGPEGRIVSFVVKELARFTLRKARQDPEIRKLLEARNIREAVFRALGVRGGMSKRFLVNLERHLYTFDPRLSPGLEEEEWTRFLELLREEQVGGETKVEQIARTLKNFAASGYKHPEEAYLPPLLSHLSWEQLVEAFQVVTNDSRETVEEKLRKMTLAKIEE